MSEPREPESPATRLFEEYLRAEKSQQADTQDLLDKAGELVDREFNLQRHGKKSAHSRWVTLLVTRGVL